MKNINKLSVPDAAAEEKLGSVLVNGLIERDPGPCPSHEEIAALIDGKITGKKRNQLMTHLSSCNSCYETFMLAVDLQKESLTEFRKEPGRMTLYKPLALAATIAIVIFALYVFYKSGAPKTTRELMDTGSPGLAGEAAKSQPAAPREFTLEEKQEKEGKEEKKENLDKEKLPSLGYLSDSSGTTATSTDEDEKPKAAVNKEETPKAPAVEEPKKKSPRQDGFLKKAGEAGTGDPAEVTPLEQTPRDELRQKDKEQDQPVGQDQKLQAAAAAPPQKKDTAVARGQKEAEPLAETEEQVVMGKAAVVKTATTPTAAPPPTNELQKNLAWSQANLLNMQSQQYRVHIPANELRDMFKQSIDLTNQLKEPLEKIKQEVAHGGDVNKIDAFVQGVAPLINVTVTKGDVSINPNIAYFLSKSEPGTVEHRFFALARSGYCEPVIGCYGLERRKDSQTRVRIEKSAGKADDSDESRLSQWKSLYPQLSGVFQEVASRTIAHLEEPIKK